MLQVLVNISIEKFCCRKETWGYAKEKVRKKKQKNKKSWKNGHKSVWDIENNGYLDARLKKREMNKIAHVFLQKCLKILIKRDVF